MRLFILTTLAALTITLNATDAAAQVRHDERLKCPCDQVAAMVADLEARVAAQTKALARTRADLAKVVGDVAKLPAAKAGNFRYGVTEAEYGVRSFIGIGNGRGFNIDAAYEDAFASQVNAGGQSSLLGKSRDLAVQEVQQRRKLAKDKALLGRLRKALAACKRKHKC